jgi:hypothetical protein
VYEPLSAKAVPCVTPRYTRKLWTGSMKEAAYPSG